MMSSSSYNNNNNNGPAIFSTGVPPPTHYPGFSVAAPLPQQSQNQNFASNANNNNDMQNQIAGLRRTIEDMTKSFAVERELISRQENERRLFNTMAAARNVYPGQPENINNQLRVAPPSIPI